MAQRHRPVYSIEPKIERRDLAAYLQAALFDVLHDEGLTEAEKVVAMRALGALARGLSDYWSQVARYYGPSAERFWFRLAGFDAEGEVPEDMRQRIGEVAAGSKEAERG